jgi:hypothetical protein
MFRAVIVPIFRSSRLCVTACGIIHPRCSRPVAGRQLRGCIVPQSVPPDNIVVHYTTTCNTQSSAPEDGQNNCPKHELIGIINKPLLLQLVGCLLFIFHYIFLRLAKQSQFIPLQNVEYFISLPCLVRKIFTFYLNGVLLFKCPIPGPKG